MNIPVSRLLGKMNEEIHKAHGAADGEKVREHLRVVRALCDLVLEQEEHSMPEPSPPAFMSPAAVQPSAMPAVKPIALKEEEANGDSLFDF